MKRYIGIYLALLVFVIQSSLVPHVSMSWDEPSSFFVGQANREFWRTGDRQFLINMWEPKLFKGYPIQYIYGEDIYPPFPFVVASFFSLVLAEANHFMSVFDAYHIGEVAIGSVGVWAMYGLAVESGLSIPIAIITTLAYALYPTIWGSMRNDAKDIPLVSMLVLSAYCFLRWLHLWQKKSWAQASMWAIAFAVSYGFSGATKPTAAVLFPIFLFWIISSALRTKQFRTQLGNIPSLIGHITLCCLLALSAFLFAWPWLWDRPFAKLWTVFSFFRTVGLNMPTPFFGTIYHAAVNLPKSYAVTILAIQTPIEITILALIGLVWGLWQFVRLGKTTPWLFVVWFSLGIGRFFVPNVIIYSWVRHFIDAMPAFFVLMGFGLEFVADGVSRLFTRVYHIRYTVYSIQNTVYRIRTCILASIGVAIILHLSWISYTLFPFEMSYFNFLVGGTKTVAKKGYFDVGQGAGVKEAMEFIAKDSGGKPVVVYPCLLGHLARFYTAPNVTLTRSPEYGNYFIAPNSISWFEGALTFGKKNQEIAYTVKRAGADLFYVFRYKIPYGWRCGWETKSNYVW